MKAAEFATLVIVLIFTCAYLIFTLSVIAAFVEDAL